jgi:D-galacturonate reductase
MVGVNGKKFPAIREHLQTNIAQVYRDMDTSYVFLIKNIRLFLLTLVISFEEFPKDGKVDPESCQQYHLFPEKHNI